MRRAMLLLSTVVLLVAWLTPSAGAAPPARPFTGSAIVEVLVGPEPDGSCDADAGWRTDTTATGTASHLGRMTFTATHCTPEEPESEVGLVHDGEMTMVAANGDELFVEYEGYSDPWVFELGAVITGTMYLSIDGGTGRFEGATGEAVMDVYLILESFDITVPLPGVFSWQGELTY